MEEFTFDGKMVISLEKTKDLAEFSLDIMELTIQSCTLVETGVPLDFEAPLGSEELRIKLPGDLNDKFQIKIEYSGIINDKMAGFYQSEYKTGQEKKVAAVTQFQENDARRAFPCFDTPGYKAVFDIEFLIDNNLTGISNEDIIEEKEEKNGKKLVRFASTPKMSTYLVFFAVGEFEKLEGQYRDIPVRVIGHPGKAVKHGEFALDFGIKALKYAEDYFGVQYPISKLDMIGTPAFAFGAMENWGAVLFRENLLLHFPGFTSTNLETTIYEVVAHELTHMWFGNLVSPTTWKYLWLNESFATYFGYGIVDAYYPERKVWEEFVTSATGSALLTDSYLETAPIELEGDTVQGMTVKNANVLYNKGGSVLRMLENYLGPEKYKDGIRKYLKDYAYDVATSDELWVAMEKATNEPVERLMGSWVFQTGYPLLKVNRNGNALEFSQSRFTLLKNSEETRWLIPITIKVYFKDKDPEILKFLLEEAEGSYELPADAINYLINPENTGFYRVLYDEASSSKIGANLANLSMIDRWSYLNNYFNFLRAGLVNLDDFLKILEAYQSIRDYVIISAISNRLYALYFYSEGKVREKVKSFAVGYLEAVLDDIGYDPKEGEDPMINTRRGGLLFNATRFGSDKAVSYAMGKFEEIKAGKTISADLFASIVRIGAYQTNDFDWFLEKLENAGNEQESVVYGSALAEFSDETAIDKTMDILFEKIPVRNQRSVIFGLALNPIAPPKLWHWYIANLDNFEKMEPYAYQSTLVYLVSECVDDEEDMMEFFEEYTRKNPSIQDPIDVAFERMKINKQFNELLT